jgi:hypothetical protein
LQRTQVHELPGGKGHFFGDNAYTRQAEARLAPRFLLMDRPPALFQILAAAARNKYQT